jgi:hypothetical protein
MNAGGHSNWDQCELISFIRTLQSLPTISDLFIEAKPHFLFWIRGEEKDFAEHFVLERLGQGLGKVWEPS